MFIERAVLLAAALVCASLGIAVSLEAGETVKAGLAIEGGNQRLIGILFLVATVVCIGMMRIIRRLR